MPNYDDLHQPQSSHSSRTSSGGSLPVTRALPPSQVPPWERNEEHGLGSFLDDFTPAGTPDRWSARRQGMVPAVWLEAEEILRLERDGRRLDWVRQFQTLALGEGESPWLVHVPSPDGEIQTLLVLAQIPPCPGDQLALAWLMDESTPVKTVTVMFPATRLSVAEYQRFARAAMAWQHGPFVVFAGKQALTPIEPPTQGGDLPEPPPLD